MNDLSSIAVLCGLGKVLMVGEAGRRLYGNSLYYFCNCSVSLKILQNKELKIKLELAWLDLAASQDQAEMHKFLR